MERRCWGRLLAFRVLAVLISVFFCQAAWAHAADGAGTDVIRVGWYERDEFQQEYSNGLLGGYGYEYLQRMAFYGGWKYEYVSGSREECISMLRSGEIDLLGGIADLPEMTSLFDLSDQSIRDTYTVLVSNPSDQRFHTDDYEAFDGMRVGTVPGDAHVSWLEAYAKEHGFTFQTVNYVDEQEAREALSAGQIDALLISHAEMTDHSGKVIAHFSPYKQYFAVKKGNQTMLKAVNDAMDQMRREDPEFIARLEDRYFRGQGAMDIALTVQEETLLREMPKVRVTLASLRKPMMYRENGTYKGIAIDLMEKLQESLGVEFVYVEATNQLEAVELVKAGKADLVSNVYTDYGWAEKNGLILSKPYIDMDYAALVRVGETPELENFSAAAVRGYLFSQYYVEKNYPEERIGWYNSEEECLKAVLNKEQDICFTNTYVANTYIQDYQFRGLYSVLINYSHGLSLAAPNESGKQVLISAMDKGISSMSEDEVYSIISSNTLYPIHELSLREMIERSPMTFVLLLGGLVALLATLIVVLVISRNNRIKDREIYRARLTAQRDSITGLYNRLSFELLVTEELGRENGRNCAFIMMDIDDFKSINDCYGHAYGDQVLVSLAETMKLSFREEDLLCRMGGDEFAVFIPKTREEDQILSRIQDLLDRMNADMEPERPYTCSIGVSVGPDQGVTFEQLYKAADAALYQAKKSGKNQVCLECVT